MAAYDSIVNVEEWISDYYLTTDDKGAAFAKRVAKEIATWKEDAKIGETPYTRLTSRRNELQTKLAKLSEDATAEQLHEVYDLVGEAFGYPELSIYEFTRGRAKLRFEGATDSRQTAVILRAQRLSSLEDLPALELLPATSNERESLSVQDGANPEEEGTLPSLEGKPVDYGAQKLASEIFLSDEAPDFIVILAGNWAIVAERESWPLGRYLAVNVALAIERNDTRANGEIQRVTSILTFEHLRQAEDGTTWWLETFDEAREHSVNVSGELREAIRRSIEIIGNDVLARRKKQGLDIDDVDGDELAHQALRYLYRILFLLFAESTPELQILPTGDNDYDEGYGLSRIRDQILVLPATEEEQTGTYLFDSLQLLFNLINTGHDPEDETNPSYVPNATQDGLRFRELDADLFSRSVTSYIDEVKLSNLALTQVLQNLLLTKQKAGSDRGFISYATLGVTELGQVYEGLMSFKGSIAKEDLIEVARNGDASKGSWLIEQSKLADLPPNSIVFEEVEDDLDGPMKRPRQHERGTFVFRQSSRDRERSASFYSPPVITEFVVGQALEELEAEGRITNADDILSLTICEPAMGSGAFAVEAVLQLAELYLEKKQEELGVRIAAEDRAVELQKAKAHIALHQVYGVDLNKTAVELAEISLWLSTMTAELKAPWFGLRLRHGNSLIGSNRTTLDPDDLSKKAYLKAFPKRHSLVSMDEAIKDGRHDDATDGRVFSFLVPSDGWGSAIDSKELKNIEPEGVAALKDWRKSVQKGLTKSQIKTLKGLTQQVEHLWELALVRMQLAEDNVRRSISIFGQEQTHESKNIRRKQIENELFHNPNSSYQRLRLVLNMWNAMWFWPVTKADSLPTYDEYLSALQDIVGTPNKTSDRKYEGSFESVRAWEQLDYAETMEKSVTGQKSINEVFAAHPWLETVAELAEEQAFFHWDLDFAPVMAKGGFDLQIGNPPWVRPRTDVDGLLSEHDPWFSIASRPTQTEKNERREAIASIPEVKRTLEKGLTESVVTSAVLRDKTQYPHLAGQQPDLYRGFMERTWGNSAETGVTSLVHPETHFTEKKAGPLRAEAYRRLRRHWHFVNELVLFDVHDLVKYGIHVYGNRRKSPLFLSAAWLYHPQTVLDSLNHDGSGELPGFKDENDNWDRRPHKERIVSVDESTLGLWSSISEEPETPLLETRMVYTVNKKAQDVLSKLAKAPRISELGLQFSRGWDETNDRRDGYFDVSWQHPESWDKVFIKGPHLGVSTPMIKQPNPTMKHNQDWTEVDLESISEDFIPATEYFPNEVETYKEDYGSWTFNGKSYFVKDTYRVAWRGMAAVTGFRTLYPSVIPRGTVHVNSVFSAGNPENNEKICIFGASVSSFLVDFFVRAKMPSGLFPSVAATLPYSDDTRIIRLYLKLNCLTNAYAELWEEITGEEWTLETPLRVAKERWEAQNQIDALVALSFGITLDELISVYRTQFPVMRRYDKEDHFDAVGRKVPAEIVKLDRALSEGEKLSVEERTWVHPQSGREYTFEYPFAPLDREADLRKWYEYYSAGAETHE